ncbi:ABC transporter permease [Cohnella silvisoli]|uniref:ABC transporter permease n=1 Tax=Cohnella silvisoli TaxID=2873699 RepID=A0ABV1KX72_9BACL|nr:ABC transporter permease [Cohnella silvisoli]MCD9024010.1 ABC transporter permease [Cohnella silvisoli]
MRDEGQEEQLGFLRALRQSRAASFRKEIFPHFRYVFQSGFGLFISAIFFSALVWYIDLIKAVPVNWPADTVGVVVISLAALRAPLRTYMLPADSVFLLAMESQVLQAYVKPALREAIWTGVLRTLAVFLIFSPIYLRAPVTLDVAHSHSIVIMAALFAIIAGCNVYAGWSERKPASRLWRVGLRIARWLATVVSIAALLLKPLIMAIPLTVMCMAVVWLLWRIPARHALPWEKLIGEEEASRRRWLSFLGWFVDVPTETSKPARRVWIAWIADSLLWQHKWSWHFLYAKVFLRGETFGAFWRWVLLSCVVVIVSGNVVADAVIYGISILIGGLQLSELRRVRFVETAATLPIAPEGRLIAAAAIARTAGMAAAALVGLVGIVTGPFRLDLWLPLIAVGLLWCGWWMPRKTSKFTDEDDL